VHRRIRNGLPRRPRRIADYRLLDPPPPIGHNRPPKSRSWTEFCWTKAQAEAWKRPPIEVVRRRVAAAQKLGLSYRDYTAVLLDRGQYVRAIVFGWTGVLAAADAPDLPAPGVLRKLAAIDRAKALIAPTASQNPDAETLKRLSFGADQIIRGDRTSGLAAALEARGLRTDAAVFVGATAVDRDDAAAAGFARFIWAANYFS